MAKNFTVKAWWLLALLLLFCESKGQVILMPQLPPTGVTQKTQLWSLMVTNTSSNSLELQIELSLLDVQTNQKVLAATSKQFLLPKGAKMIDWNAVQPVTYNGNGNLPPSASGWLPAGYYKVCYAAFRVLNDSRQPLTEECAETEVAPLSPPQLAVPADKSFVEGSYPQFNWLPPAPLMLFQHLTYELKIVERLPDQSTDEAIQKNLPFLLKDNIAQVQFNYPAGNRAFEKGKDYLWQVTATDVNHYSVKTDVWQFTTKKNVDAETQSVGYTRLQQVVVPSQFISTGILKFVYINAADDPAVFYSIYKAEEANRKLKPDGKLTLRPGENFVDLPLEDIRSLQSDTSYVFELVNSGGERWRIGFIYKEKANTKNN